MESVPFQSRPGGSPALAALLAAGVIRPDSRVLDICCGEGPDALLLARAGVRCVVGIDTERSALRIARDRARTLRVPATFRRLALPDALRSRLREASFDVVIDTMGADNVVYGDADRPSRTREAALVAGIARVLRDGGIWVHHRRHYHPATGLHRSVQIFPRGSARFFKLGTAYPTHLAEYRREDHGDEDRDEGVVPSIASVYFAVATRRPR